MSERRRRSSDTFYVSPAPQANLIFNAEITINPITFKILISVGHHRHRDGARIRRGVAGDLDVVSSLQAGETFRHHDLAAGNDSASSRTAGPVDRQRGRQ